MSGRAIIIGAGPAGLTAAHELLERTDIVPVVLEADAQVGGLSKTIRYKGNGLDIGGHRFFSKSQHVMDWWLGILALESGADPEGDDRVMLERSRKSRIYFDGKLFDYPLALNPNTLLRLGLARTFRIGMSYLYRLAFPRRDVRSLEDFFINRFGDELYRTFFKAYTEKVWGVACTEISPSWGAQRIKDVSVATAIRHFLSSPFRKGDDVAQQGVSTSMIERFLYPKFGPGQIWELTADAIRERGGEVLLRHEVTGIALDEGRVVGVEAVDTASGTSHRFEGDYFFSTMPVNGLVRAMNPAPPPEVCEVAGALAYRDFITVGMLVDRLHPDSPVSKDGLPIDNWLYIQEPKVRLGRLQFYNNWSPYLIAQPDKVWLGLEYFCQQDDELWRMPDEDMLEFAAAELASIGIIDTGDVIDGKVVRVEKAYPAYFGAYDRFETIRAYVDPIENLFLIGRNGMHKYNNQDHSMLTAMAAVDNLVEGIQSKDKIWDINAEPDYHEERST